MEDRINDGAGPWGEISDGVQDRRLITGKALA
jgi:hypothetical protein